MPDLLAKCDWHESTLFLVLPEDPERIAVRRFESRQASSRMYVPEVEVLRLKAENAKLLEQLESLRPTDCEGNALDIADTVSMLRSEYDGDHEWEDVVTELVLTKWGGDRWIVRGSKGEAWACDCTKTGYDEDAYEASDDVEPFGEPTLLEVENAKLQSQCADLVDERERLFQANVEKNGEVLRLVNENAKLREQIHWLKRGDVLHVLTDQELADQQKHEREMQASITALDAENAALRQQLADVTESMGRVEERCAKLRYLVEDMLSCIEIRAAFGRPPTTEMYEEFAQQARELGVEVEA